MYFGVKLEHGMQFQEEETNKFAQLHSQTHASAQPNIQQPHSIFLTN